VNAINMIAYFDTGPKSLPENRIDGKSKNTMLWLRTYFSMFLKLSVSFDFSIISQDNDITQNIIRQDISKIHNQLLMKKIAVMMLVAHLQF
jgi:hypothetical protein